MGLGGLRPRRRRRLPLVEPKCAGAALRPREPPVSFDTLAPHYRAMELLLAGNLLQRCRTAFLPETLGCRRALLLGEGPGRFLAELLRLNPRVEVTCVERSPKMVAAAQLALRRAGMDAAQVHFLPEDALAWDPPWAAFDLVATHFFLDCFPPEDLARLIPKIAQAATPDALWLLSDFHQPERGWQKWRAQAILALMYAFFRRAAGLSARRLASPDPLLKAEGFHPTRRIHLNFSLLHSTLWRRWPTPEG